MENKIRILSKIGKGTFGSVYKVKNIITGNIYALKKIPYTNSDEKDKQNIINELRILKFCNCPFLLTYHYSYITNHHINIITNFAKYSDLFKIINSHKLKKKKFKEETIWGYFIQVALGIEYLHFNNIIHRDIKVANVFLDENDRIYLGDFGICKVLNMEQHLTDTQIGTPYYMSPEIVKRKTYSKKIDIWSLGCLLYELIYFKPPFAGKDLSSLFKNVLKKKFDKSIDKNIIKSRYDDVKSRYRKHNAYGQYNPNRAHLPGIYDYNKYNRAHINTPNKQKINIKENDSEKRNENFGNYSDELIKLVDKILILDSKKRLGIDEILELPELVDRVKDVKNKYNYQRKEKIEQFQFKFNKIALPKYYHTWKIFIDQINKDDEYLDTPFPSPNRLKKKNSHSSIRNRLKSLDDKYINKDINKYINKDINEDISIEKRIKKNDKLNKHKYKSINNDNLNNKFEPCLPNILNNHNSDKIPRKSPCESPYKSPYESSCESHIKLPIIERKISTIEKTITNINKNIKDINNNINLLQRNRKQERFSYKNQNINSNRYFDNNNNNNYNSRNNYKNNRRFQNNTEFKRFENHNNNYNNPKQRYLPPLF
jgi:serine/threonine protein kinase